MNLVYLEGATAFAQVSWRNLYFQYQNYDYNSYFGFRKS